MTKETKDYSIKKVLRKIGPTGSYIDEQILEVKGRSLKEVEKAFDKRWEK